MGAWYSVIPCAYFKDGECLETMEDHLRKGLELIDELYVKRNYCTLLGRLMDVSPETAEKILRRAYILHDVGKCLEIFQKRREKFYYHEFYSYLLAKTVINSEIAQVAILLHHHNWVRGSMVRRPPSLKLVEGCPELIEKLSGLKIPAEIPWRDPNKEYSIVDNILQNNLRAVYAILLPIVVADNYAAACNRDGKGSMLGKEILETLKVRGWNLAGCLSGRI